MWTRLSLEWNGPRSVGSEICKPLLVSKCSKALLQTRNVCACVRACHSNTQWNLIIYRCAQWSAPARDTKYITFIWFVCEWVGSAAQRNSTVYGTRNFRNHSKAPRICGISYVRCLRIFHTKFGRMDETLWTVHIVDIPISYSKLELFRFSIWRKTSIHAAYSLYTKIVQIYLFRGDETKTMLRGEMGDRMATRKITNSFT